MKLGESEWNFVKKISKGALFTATNKDGESNTMTVSWGGCGFLWGKEVAFIFVRPQRYTHEFCENGDTFTLSFFGKERASTLSYCGQKSGREVDKFKECKLSYKEENGVVFEDAEHTLILKKLYAQNLKKDCFIDTGSLKWYENNDFHRMYICEVIELK